MVPLSYLGCVNIGVRIVREQFPDAQLYEVQGAAPNNAYVNDVKKFSRLQLIFQAEEGRGTAIISTSSQWGEFGPVYYVGQPWLEDVVIPWPIDMDATEADRLLREHYSGPYNSMLLRHPLYPGYNEPYYIFNVAGEGFVFVGVNSRKVFRPAQGLAEKMAIPTSASEKD
ncbi:hypothetical protein JDV02_002442 [Purpureocillium takamizusanense]|uniref:Uncharacterized protein n=1 Tax=Purpureocillium takamizusanense TaxID=2060973 RepID=A0A9Q8QAA3_9HYPO|nr:uncharacterized protein JDV02_002442 [Purpureocillium takamizusanense]UNI15960.1 hypothetical protein JDV02_002442 [Purpureocillium takamizusanense]